MLQKGFALFDFDGTIIRGDSIVPFLCYSVWRRFTSPVALFRALMAYLRYCLHLSTAECAKEAAIAWMKGKTEDEMAAFALSFYTQRLQKRVYADALAEMHACRKAGLTVLLVSASPDAYLRHLLDVLPADDIIATRCATDAEGRYLGKLASANCRGFEKTLRIAEYLAAKGAELDKSISRGYGDSAADIPMLSLVQKGTVINAGPRLRAQTPALEHVRWKKLLGRP